MSDMCGRDDDPTQHDQKEPDMPEFIILTPTWEALLPAMLDAHANLTRQLEASWCDGHEEGWCSIHGAMHRDGDPIVTNPCVLASDQRRLSTWRNAAQKSRADILAEFTRMAEAADRYNERVRNEQEAMPEGHHRFVPSYAIGGAASPCATCGAYGSAPVHSTKRQES